MESLDIELFAGLTFYDGQFNIRSSLETVKISQANFRGMHNFYALCKKITSAKDNQPVILSKLHWDGFCHELVYSLHETNIIYGYVSNRKHSM